MNLYDLAPISALVSGASWAVATLIDLITPFAGSASAALAIITLTVLVRVVLVPVGISQVRAERTRRRLAPRIAALRRRHRGSPELLQRRLQELYAEEHASPLAGCLPLLAQTPVLMGVYGLFALPVVGGRDNTLLAATLLDVRLGDGLVGQVASGTVTPASAALLLGIAALIAVVAYGSRRLLAMPAAPGAQDGSGVGVGLTRALGLLPFATAIVALVVPLAAALYLATTTGWTLGERLLLRRLLDPGSRSSGR